MIALYNALLLLLAPLWIPALTLYVVASARRRRDFAERLRRLPTSTPDGVWLHAASVGEAEAAAPLLRGLLQAGIPVVATTLTPSGRDRLRARVPGIAVRLAPLDLGWLVRGSLGRVRPRALVLIETELWPNLIGEAARAGAAVLVVSGRLSDRSYPRYRLLRPLYASLLRRVRRVAAQTREDAARFLALGAREGTVVVGGDLKLDAAAGEAPSPELLLAIGPEPWLLGGSTHADEELLLLDAWERLRAAGAPLRLVLVPRHPDRAQQVLELARSRGHRAELRSKGAARAEVAVVDSVGELPALYARAALVFAGGTLAPVGGHNLLEPVLAGRVVAVGPHTENQRAQLRALEPLGVLRRVDTGSLHPTLAALWRDPARDAPARSAGARLAAHRGASAHALELVLGVLRRAGAT